MARVDVEKGSGWSGEEVVAINTVHVGIHGGGLPAKAGQHFCPCVVSLRASLRSSSDSMVAGGLIAAFLELFFSLAHMHDSFGLFP